MCLLCLVSEMTKEREAKSNKNNEDAFQIVNEMHNIREKAKRLDKENEILTNKIDGIQADNVKLQHSNKDLTEQIDELKSNSQMLTSKVM